MYNAVFEADNGEKYVFGVNGNTVFDMDFGNGVSVNIGTSQGFSQVGETVETKSVGGRVINVKGAVFGNIAETRKRMRRVFSPFTSGKLVFENQYYTRVHVKNAPSFSPVKNDGRFTMQLFAPFPYFYSVNEKTENIGTIKPMFSFPVNYAVPHIFGTKGDSKYTNIFNDGDVTVPFSVWIYTSGESSNITISNLSTFETLKFNGTLYAGESVELYRDKDGIIRAFKLSGGEKEDILSWIDEESTLFQLYAGDNLISAVDDSGGNSLTVKFSFNTAVSALYED